MKSLLLATTFNRILSQYRVNATTNNRKRRMLYGYAFYLFTISMKIHFEIQITKNLKYMSVRKFQVNVLAHKTCIEYFRGFKYLKNTTKKNLCACVYVIEIRCDLQRNEKIKYASLCLFYTIVNGSTPWICIVTFGIHMLHWNREHKHNISHDLNSRNKRISHENVSEKKTRKSFQVKWRKRHICQHRLVYANKWETKTKSTN